MIPYFLRKKPIAIQIDNYCLRKSIRHPVAASRHKEILKRFSRRYKVASVSEIGVEHVRAFVDEEVSEFFRWQAHHVLKQFFGYCDRMGYISITLSRFSPRDRVETINMEKIHPLLHVSQIVRVRHLKDEKGLSYREIKAVMEKEDSRKYDLKNLHSWYHHAAVLPS